MQICSHRFQLAVACLLGLPSTAAAEVIELEVGFERPVVTIDAAGLTHVQVPGSTVHGIPGEPALPGRALLVALPPGQDVVAVEVERIAVGELAGPFVLSPAQPPRRLSQRGPFPFVPANVAVYGDRAVFPEQVAVLGPQQRAAGLEVAPIVVYPVVWDRATGSLSFSRRIRLRLSTVARQTVATDLARFRGLGTDLERARRWLANPVLLERYTPPPRRLAPPYRYVIITSAALSACAGPDNLQALAASKDARGIPSRIETVETIRGAYAGRDDAEKIRAFIRDLYDNNGTEFVLLAGDADRASMGDETEDPVVPVRDLYGILDTEEDVIPSDLYYACLDGDFDDNQNGVFGEPADNPDVLPDVMVGRAAVDSCAEVSNFVRKTLAYQNAEPAALGDVHMLGEFLWGDGSNDYDWGKGYLEQIRVSSNDLDMSTMGFSESPFYVVDTMYDRDLGGSEAWDGADVLNLINNQSPHIINHLGHSYTVYNMRLLSDDIIDGMRNAQPFFEYSQGCYCGAFDNRLDSEYNRVVYGQDAFVEHMTVDAYGAFAAVMNTRYGLGGISNYYHRLFWDALFDSGEARLGPMHAHSLASMAGWVADANYRWVQYEVTLFGDPELSLHHSVPVAEPVILLPAEGPWFGTIYGYDDVEQGQITIENGGEAPLNWTASWTASWLGVTPQTGTAPTDIVVTADPAGLGVGLHQGEITFAAADAINSPQTLPVDYYVVEVAAATAAYTPGMSPTVDGTLSLGEYNDATVVDMSSRSGPATMYALNDGDYLYLAFAIEGDTDVSVNDALVLLIDGDNDDRWPTAPGSTDGQLQVYGAGDQAFYRTYNDGSGLQQEDSPSTPIGVTSAFGTEAGHRWIELRFDLSTSVIDRAVGESFGVFAFYHDWVVSDYVMEAVWPDIASSFDDGRFLGNVTLGTTGSNVAASPAPLSFSAAQSASPTEPQFVTLTSSSSETLSFSLTTSQPWLHVSPESGSTPAMVQVWVDPAGLSVGARAGAVTVSAAAADNSPFDIGVTLDVVEAPPVFALSTGHLGFAYTVGDLLPASQTIDVDNVGGGSLDWTASTTATWVTLAPTTGAAPGQIEVTPVITAGMEPGYRAGTLVLSAPGAEDAVVSLGLDLAAQPHLVVGPVAVTRSDVPGAGSVTIELTIENLEQGNMPWSASTSASWAAVAPGSGTYVTSHPSRVGLTLDPGSLALGLHEAAVIVSSAAADNSPVTVPITWTLVDAPVIAVSPAELSFAAPSVGSSPPSQTLSIDNPGSGLLGFSVACDPAWLSCTPASGTAPAAITVAVDASGLAVGRHAGSITVSAAAAIHSPVVVDVGLVIGAGSNAAPPAPVLLSPIDGAANQTTRPTLGIENAADPDGDAVTYSFEVAVSGASTPVVVVEEVAEETGDSTETTLPAQLAPSVTYTWRARAVDVWGAKGAWSDSWSFTVAPANSSRPSDATSRGCACSSSGDPPAWLLGLGALFLMSRRRRVESSNSRSGRSGRSGRAARPPAR